MPRTKIAKDEREVLPSEKWLVLFRKNGSQFIRQFRAEGYYEAYDALLTYAEKRKLEILWFKEKRNCGSKYMNKNYAQLESICVYCRAIFNETEPIPCIDDNCTAEFCSKSCLNEHYKFRHGKAVRSR